MRIGLGRGVGGRFSNLMGWVWLDWAGLLMEVEIYWK